MNETSPELEHPAQGSLELGPRVVYEQPLTERMRTFLRLELLFVQIRHHRERGTEWDIRAIVGRLMDILAILGRGDIRMEVLKELERINQTLAPFRERDDIDAGRLRGILERLDVLGSELSAHGVQIAQGMRRSEFLASIRHRSTIPGGTCRFDLPAFHFWLSRPQEERNADYILENGAGLKAQSLEDLEFKLRELLETPSRIERMGKNAGRCARPRAAFSVAASVAKALHRRAS